MAQQYLNRANIHSVHEQVCGETMSEGMASDSLDYPGLPHCLFDGLLKRGLMNMMAPKGF